MIYCVSQEIVRQTQKNKKAKQQRFGFASQIFRPFPLWRWKEEEDAGVNPANPRSRLHSLPSCFSHASDQ